MPDRRPSVVAVGLSPPHNSPADGVDFGQADSLANSAVSARRRSVAAVGATTVAGGAHEAQPGGVGGGEGGGGREALPWRAV